jgi:hypothetical protein
MLFLPFYIKNGFLNLLKSGKILSNNHFKSMFIILLMYFYIIIQLPINCILMCLIIYFMFET